VAEAHLHDFGFDPGPVDGIYTAQTQDAVRAYQAMSPSIGSYVTRIPPREGQDASAVGLWESQAC
jgi:hypothetical protein